MSLRLALLLTLSLSTGCTQCPSQPGPTPKPTPGPAPDPGRCNDGVCWPTTEDCLRCPGDCPCLGGGACERGVCMPPGFRFRGCTAVGRSCTESLCPGACQVQPVLSDPKLCPDPAFPIPCVCSCP